MSAIAELEQDRVVEGVYAVAKKERLRTRAGAPYLAVELVDPSGRIEGRVWSDVDLLDGRFAEGDAVRVLGRVDRFRDRLQLEIRSLEPRRGSRSGRARAGDAPRCRRARRVLEFLAGEISHPGLRPAVGRFVGDDDLRARLRSLPATVDGHHSYAGGLLEHTVGVATICREMASSTRDCAPISCSRPRSCTTSAAPVELTRGPGFRPTDEGRLLGHVHLGLRLIEERAAPLEAGVRAELLHAVGSHHDARMARTAEAAVLYHANQLDAVAAHARFGGLGNSSSTRPAILSRIWRTTSTGIPAGSCRFQSR